MSRLAASLLAAVLLAGCVQRGYHVRRGGGTPLKGRYVEEGLASWYGLSSKGRVFEHGGPTASGVPYDMNAMTAAHKTLPLGTRVKVTNLDNGRTILVVVNDRGPYIEGRIIDLTLRGARALGFKDEGTARVRIEAYQ